MTKMEIAELTTQICIALLNAQKSVTFFLNRNNPEGTNKIFNSIFDNIASKVEEKK